MPTADAPDRRLRLRPGLGVVRRDDARLQVGLDPPLRALLDDRPDVRRLLRALVEGRADSTSSDLTALQPLLRAGAVVGADVVSAAPPVLVAQRGASAPARAEARRRSLVRVVDGRPDDPVPAPVAELEQLLRRSGVGLDAPDDGPVDLAVVVCAGVLPRPRLDDLVRDGTPHLVVELGARCCRVGPLVVPGQTACLRCVDADEAERDPGRPLVLAQLGELAVETPVDPALGAAALAWAARDVLRALDGDVPFARSAVATVDLDRPVPEVRSVLRHPLCGCAWDVELC